MARDWEQEAERSDSVLQGFRIQADPEHKPTSNRLEVLTSTWLHFHV